MKDVLLDIQYDPEQNNYIYSFRMSEQKKRDLEKRLKEYGGHFGRSNSKLFAGSYGSEK